MKRVKQSVEEELDAFRHQHSDVRDRMHVDELQRRTIHAERARDDLILTVQVAFPCKTLKLKLYENCLNQK